MMVRPHDLLRLVDPGEVLADAPAWVRATLARTPWVVVRRNAASKGFVAVGVRGDDRSHRQALTIPRDMIGELIAPEQLAGSRAPTRDLPVFRALAGARGHLEDCAMPWGPTGSVGFELATGVATATPDSDLDLLVRAPALSPRVMQRLAELHARLQNIPVRVDCQVETAGGAIALAELACAPSEVLVKTTAGPNLVPIAGLLV